MGKSLRASLYILFLLIFSWVSVELFFEKQADQLMTSFFSESDSESKSELDKLSVIYYDEVDTLEPSYTDPALWKRLINIYDPLVRLDRDLKIKPALALSWGLIDETTWKFKLRPDVKFHDGSDFTVDDVIASFERAKSFDRFKSLEKLIKIDDYSFTVKTKQPDPLLLQTLARIFIIPAEKKDRTMLLDDAIGTGPYTLLSWEKGKKMILQRSGSYWGDRPKFKKVEIIYEPDKSRRVSMFVNGEVDLLDFVPYDAASFVEKRGFQIEQIPSLQVEFLLFNFNSEFAKQKINRRVVSLLIDDDYLDEAFGDYVRKVNQFVSNGTFGFNPEIGDHEYDFEKAKNLIADNGLEGQLVQIHLPLGMEFLGEYLREQLTSAGLSPIVSYLENDRLIKSMTDLKADVYFLGFRADTGDSADFLDVLVHSEGNFNLTKYSNPEIDELIEAGDVEMDVGKRLALLQKTLKILTEDEVLGVPLIEYETLYSFNKKINLVPRIDGFIYFDELEIK